MGLVGDAGLDYTWYFQDSIFTESQQFLLQPHASITLSTQIFLIADIYVFIWLGVLALVGMILAPVLAICQHKV